MTLGIIGRKIGMTRVFDDNGAVVPVTVIQAGPCPIVQIKRRETDGYTALQLGFGAKREDHVLRPMKGHFAKSKVAPTQVLREFRVPDVEGYELGASLDVSIFKPGERVDLIGTSKGRGFASQVKRHHSKGGPASHGSMYHRRTGSLGGSSDPSRVWKGKRMAAHMGNKRKTVQNVKVVHVDPVKNLILVGGAVPGHPRQIVLVSKSLKVANKSAARAAKGKA